MAIALGIFIGIVVGLILGVLIGAAITGVLVEENTETYFKHTDDFICDTVRKQVRSEVEFYKTIGA